MKKLKSARVSIRDIAQSAGVSKTTVCAALQNHSDIGVSTRERIFRLAKKMGYAPDARIASQMASVRKAASKDLLPIAWIDTNPEKDSWRKYKFLSPYLESARERAHSLGYRLEEIWTHQPGLGIGLDRQIQKSIVDFKKIFQ